MQPIILTEEQMKILKELSQTHSRIQVCDPDGNVVGAVDPDLSPEFLAEMKRRAAAPGPRYSGEQVQNHLHALQAAWDREGPFDQVRMHQILKEIKGAEKS